MDTNLNSIDDNIRKMEESGSNINRLDLMVSAMWELMMEKGFTREQLNSKLDSLKDSGNSLEARKNAIMCPKCGKKVFENPRTPFEGTCLYCGHIVTIYPGESVEFKGNEVESKPAGDPDSYDPADPQNIFSSSYFGSDQDLF